MPALPSEALTFVVNVKGDRGHMISSDASAAENAAVSTSLRQSPITLGWLLKRSILWAMILFLAVVAACLLYGLAGSSPDADQSLMSAPGGKVPIAAAKT